MSDFNTSFINMYDLLICLTNAFDLISPELANHHKQVAYLAFRIGERMELPAEQKKELVLAGLLHDVGALSLNERLELIENEPPTAQNHAFRGAKLLEDFAPLRGAASVIRYHHIPWNNGEGACFKGKKVSSLSHVLHLADRIAVSIDRDEEVIGQIPRIQNRIQSQKNTAFLPEAVDAFLAISRQEYIWLDTVYKPLLYILPQIVSFDLLQMSMDEVIDLSRIFSAVIDFRSPFTARHSAGVAATAEKLAELTGFSEKERKMMLVAGYLHDLGKLAVKNEILEKPEKLNSEEFDAIRSHTFYTFRLLQTIQGFDVINKWASFHHEKLNGNGYPFHLRGENLSLGSRIMAVADIFTAITEERPYRRGMSERQAVAVLHSLTDDGSICPYVVSVLVGHFEQINGIRQKAQKEAEAKYENFMDSASCE